MSENKPKKLEEVQMNFTVNTAEPDEKVEGIKARIEEIRTQINEKKGEQRIKPLQGMNVVPLAFTVKNITFACLVKADGDSPAKLEKLIGEIEGVQAIEVEAIKPP